MPLQRYGVLKGHVVDRRLATNNSPHYQIHLTDQTKSHRIAVNVRSQLAPSEVLYLVADEFAHPITSQLPPVAFGFTELPSAPGGLALDFVRGNLFDRSLMKPLPLSASGEDNDLNEKLESQVGRARNEEDAVLYAFGEPFGPETQADRYFGFTPTNGLHDIHMNQGNSGRFIPQDGVWQDGALLFHFPSQDRWAAIFLAFQSQSFHTDDVTGHRIDVPAETDDLPVAIVAALVNSAGDEAVGETVTLINLTDRERDLNGWNLADRNKNRKSLNGVRIAAHGTAVVKVRDNSAMQLSNNGGIITLLDAGGNKVHGVAYTKEQASRDGRLVLF
jgi:uncharacterized protein YukJ